MKKFITAILLLMAGLLPAKADNITVDGVSRTYMAYAPQDLGENRPLFIFCHGSGQDINYTLNTQFRDTSKGISIENVCDTAKFVIVFPNGIYAIALYTADVEYGDCILGQLILTANSYETTGIRATLNNKEKFLDEPSGKAERINDNCVYDLQGRRVTNPQHGLYITNGKKIFVR